jgi:hypothetical protein
MDFNEWLDYGIEHGYCSPQFCSTHDAAPMTDSEEKAWEEGFDPCMHVVRLGTTIDWEY